MMTWQVDKHTAYTSHIALVNVTPFLVVEKPFVGFGLIFGFGVWFVGGEGGSFFFLCKQKNGQQKARTRCS